MLMLVSFTIYSELKSIQLSRHDEHHILNYYTVKQHDPLPPCRAPDDAGAAGPAAVRHHVPHLPHTWCSPAYLPPQSTGNIVIILLLAVSGF